MLNSIKAFEFIDYLEGNTEKDKKSLVNTF